MPRKKDVEQMSVFELMNEVDRLRSLDRTEQLESEVGHLKHEVKRLKAEKEKLQRSLDFVKYGYFGMVERARDRRVEAQGRRRAQRRS